MILLLPHAMRDADADADAQLLLFAYDASKNRLDGEFLIASMHSLHDIQLATNRENGMLEEYVH